MDSWYVLNKVNNDVTIDINEDIGFFGVTANSFINEVKAQEADSLHLNMASLGGSLTDALAIYDFLKTFKGTTTGRYTGPSASSMTVIAAALDKVEAGSNTPILVHNPWTMTMGSADELRKEADNLDKFQDAIVNIYKKQTGQRKSAIKSLMDEDKWIDAKEAKAFGLIDKIVEPENVQNVTQTVMNKVRDKKYPDIPNKFQNIKTKTMENQEDTTEKVEKSALDKILAFITPKEKEEKKEGLSDEEIKAIADATNAQIEAVTVEKEAEIENKKKELSEKDTEMAELRAKIAKYEAKETVIPAKEDDVKTKDKKEPQFSSLVNQQVKKIQNRLGLN